MFHAAQLCWFTRLAASAAALAAMSAAALAAEVSNISISDDPQIGYTRVTIESDELLDYRMFTLAEQGLRLVIDTQRVDWGIPGEPAANGQHRAAGQGLVSQYRFAQNTTEASRLVLDLASPVEVTQQFLLRPDAASDRYRLVLDLQPTGFGRFAANTGFIAPAAPAPEPVVAAQAEPREETPPARITSAPPQVPARPVIVVDAGHGGRDPGAISATGTFEKDINLRAALVLRDILEATGRYEVVMTRATDVFHELDTRVEIARTHDADLFISLHSDSAANRSASGASVYTLSDRGAVRAKEKVDTSNWVLDILAPSRTAEVNDILLEFTQRDTKNQSTRFARMLLEEVGNGRKLLRNSHREANLYVLLAPDVPAVLLEMGFLSNSADEANLSSSTYRASLMQAVADSIDEYFAGRELQYAGN